ncbi:ABC transporter permease [Floridanema aerugineum]|uniref:Iron export ABC transporter permease subunit FetB n=1 Tax=Floridaenema aerugineum BLCC-F46 TaxID=3153654 RepID=A0ABV4XG03_9CYAN
MDLIQLDPIKLVISLGLIVVAIGLSATQKLGLSWSIARSTIQTIVQLLVVGYFLAAAFEFKNPWAVLLVVAVMLTIAATVARNRVNQRIPQILPVVWLSLLISTTLTLVYINLLVLQPRPWYEPQYFIPLAGILLGNAMNGAAIALERLTSSLNSNRLEIETHLSLGATPQQAVALYRKEAIKAAMIPNLNTMLVVGVVTLPGTFTGQLLSGVYPLDAALYQMLILFIQLFATLITTFLVTQGISRQVFNWAEQLKI